MSIASFQQPSTTSTPSHLQSTFSLHSRSLVFLKAIQAPETCKTNSLSNPIPFLLASFFSC
eukprot:jgi/Hompol1/3657/HPOL_006669-RA